MKGIDVTDRLGGSFSRYAPEVRLELYPRKEFFVQWSRSPDSVVVKTSDYLLDAPDQVLGGIVSMVCRRLEGAKASLPPEFMELVRSDRFITSKRPVYIDRSRNLTRSDVGTHFCIYDSVQRLLDSGLVTPGDIDNSYFSWTRKETKRKVGFCSTMFRVVGISSVLDDPSVPDSVRDYVVYHEILHLRQRFRVPHNAHNALFREHEHRFPDWQAAEARLSKL